MTSLQSANTRKGFWEDLKGSGISLETATKLGIRVVDGAELIAYGFKNERLINSDSLFLLFPYYTPFGEQFIWEDSDGHWWPYARVKLPDDLRSGGWKYAQPKGSPVFPYIPQAIDDRFAGMLGCDCDGADIEYRKPVPLLRVVEGEKKAIASTLAGTPTVGLGGVWSWKKEESTLIDWLMEFVLAADRVQFLFDSDVWTNPKVQKALEAVTLFLVDNMRSLSLASMFGGVPDNLKFFDPQIHDGSFNYFRGFTGDKLEDYPLIMNKICYGLLPLHPLAKESKSYRYGLDDYLAEWSLGEVDGFRELIDTCVPAATIRGQSDSEVETVDSLVGDKLWKHPKIDLALYKEKEGKSKGFIKLPLKFSWPSDKANQLVCLLVKFTGIMGEIRRVGTVYYRWNKSKKVLVSDRSEVLNSRIETYCSLYGFTWAANGLMTEGVLALKTIDRELPDTSGWMGFANHDVDRTDGTFTPVNPRNAVMSRSSTEWLVGTGEVEGGLRGFLGSADRLLGSTELLRVLLRLSVLPPQRRPAFVVNLFGESGSGKSALMQVIQQVLPGVTMATLGNVFRGNSAMKGCIPLSWQGKVMVVDGDYKGGRLDSRSIQLFNQIAGGENVPYRQMGGNVVEDSATFALWLASNKVLKLAAEDSDGFLRRIIPLEVVAPRLNGQGRPGWIRETVQKEGAAIVQWIFGLNQFEAVTWFQDYLHSEELKVSRSAYMARASNGVQNWLEWNCAAIDGEVAGVDAVPLIEPQVMLTGALRAALGEREPCYWVPATAAFDAYSRYCRSVATQHQSKENFYQSVLNLGGEWPQSESRGNGHGMVKPTRQIVSLHADGGTEVALKRWIALPEGYWPERWKK